MLDVLYSNYPILDFLENKFVEKLRKIKKYKIVNAQNLDYLAKKEYGDVSLWWIIALYNNIIDPFNIELSEIKIPDANEIETIIFDFEIKE